MNQLSEQQICQLIQQRLETLQRAGLVNLLNSPQRSQLRAATNDEPQETPGTSPATEEPMPPKKRSVRLPDETDENRADNQNPPDIPQSLEQPSLSLDERVQFLSQTSVEVAACTRCHELAETRTQTVFGIGDPKARLVFLGEAPGADEDRQGEPFVGRAGQLLTKIIEACSLRREDVYILNILKCRPPGNRNPTPAEAANCREFLLRQLRAIQPEFICCLGAVATQNLLDTQTPIGRLRGSFHDFHGIRVVATYHPAYLLRNPSAKRHTWDDMKMLMREMGIEINGPDTQ